MTCSCCGEERDQSTVAELLCHPEVRICRVCLHWLRSEAGAPDTTPILPVRDLDEAAAFYEVAGFDVRPYEGGGFAFVEYEGESVFDLDVTEDIDPKTNAAGCYLIAPRVEEWQAELAEASLMVTPVEDQPWGMREFTLTDPSGNDVRIGRSAG